MSDLAEGWSAVEIERGMSAIIDYRGKTPKKTSAGVPLVTAKVVKGGRVIDSKREYIAAADYDSWMRRGLPMAGDIVVTTEAPLGEVAQLDGSRVALAQRLITLRPIPSLLDSDFLLYAMQSSFVQDQLRARATGTTVLGIKQSELRRVRIPVPPMGEQRVIGATLRVLDRRIDLNSRMNRTLEAMARALFRSWFVDFDPVRAKIEGRPTGLPDNVAALFPDRLVDSPIGDVPEGWETAPLTRLANIGGGRQLAPDLVAKTGQIPVFGANGIMGFTRHATHDGFVIVFGRVGANCGSIHWTYEGAWVNNNASALVPVNCPEFTLQTLLHADFHHLRTGSAQPFIPQTTLSATLHLLPPAILQREFCDFARPLRIRQSLGDTQSATLQQMRTLLLPRLLSGEIRIPNTEGGAVP